MAAIRLKNKHNGFTMLPNRFIDEYMPLASGEYVKVYLYLLRQANLSEPHVSVEDIAEHLMYTEKDVIRALKYWEKQGLLTASFSKEQECEAIELLLPGPAPSAKSAAVPDLSAAGSSDVFRAIPVNSSRHVGPEEHSADQKPDLYGATGRGSDLRGAADRSSDLHRATDRGADLHGAAEQRDTAISMSNADEGRETDGLPSSPHPENSRGFAVPAASQTAPPPRRAYTPQEIEQITERESLEEMLFVIGSYMGRPLSQTELTSIIYFYDQLGFSIELIEYLFEYCISKNHKNIRYIEKTALNWAEDHVTTPEEARQRTAGYSEECFAVLKAFGISGRNPVEGEIRFVKQWRNEYGMSMELIVDACSRTMSSIHTPSFEYADGILSGWKKAGVKTPEDVRKLDEAFAAKKQQAGAGRQAGRQNRGQSDASKFGTRTGSGRPTQTRFSNFEERSYSSGDDADLEKLLLSQYRGKSGSN